MPWKTKADAERHLKNPTDKQVEVFLAVSNSVFFACMEEAGENPTEEQRKACEGKAIRIAKAAADIARKDTVDTVQTNLNTHASTTPPVHGLPALGAAFQLMRMNSGATAMEWANFDNVKAVVAARTLRT